MSIKTFYFQDQLMMSDGCIGEQKDSIEAYLLKAIPFAVKAERATRTDDKNGIDWWVTLQSGRVIGVDVKVRDKDYGKDDLALEIWSVIEKQIIGWTRNPLKKTDYIVWLWKDTGRFVCVQFPWLCLIFINNWEMWYKKFQTSIQRTEGNVPYHSECVFVPRKLVNTLIFKAMEGTAR